mmetsp:Transcript_32293/g.95038  ORF Transcript_32293/g.95038 Transcript_32293/m.95038 type:complete len:415 (-) Transcript_32293:457-1701(-)
MASGPPICLVVHTPLRLISAHPTAHRYVYNREDPQSGLYPYKCRKQQGCSRSTGGTDGWDFRSFDPTFWSHFESLIASLQTEGVVADLILFHPYDDGQWGFDCMGGRDPSAYNISNDAHYLRYAVARLAAFSNVWWSMANEFDFVGCKRAGVGHEHAWWGTSFVAEASPVWDELFAVLAAEDPYPRERSIHNGPVLYNHSRPWVSHVSLQANWKLTTKLMQTTGKPVIWDEVHYEGDIPQDWGGLTWAGMADQFWRGLSLGVHVGHGETILQPGIEDDKQQLWWSKGGRLRGTSLLRVAWQREYLDTVPSWSSLEARNYTHDDCTGSVLVKQGEYALFHIRQRARNCSLSLPGLSSGDTFRATKLNWWEMTTTLLADKAHQPITIDLVKYRDFRLPCNVELRRVVGQAGPVASL